MRCLLLAAAVMLLCLASVRASINMRPFILGDEVPDEDDAQVRKSVLKKCNDVIACHTTPKFLRLWGSYFTSANPKPVLELPTGRRIEGIVPIEHYIDSFTAYGLENYSYINVSDPIASTDTCTFTRVAKWQQHGCDFSQPGSVTLRYRHNKQYNMGMEIIEWIEHWDAIALSEQYEACHLKIKKAGKGGIKEGKVKDIPERQIIDLQEKIIGDEKVSDEVPKGGNTGPLLYVPETERPPARQANVHVDIVESIAQEYNEAHPEEAEKQKVEKEEALRNPRVPDFPVPPHDEEL